MVEGRLLKQSNYSKVSEIRVSSKDWKEYREKCIHLVKELTSLNYYFDAYKIFVNKEFANEEKLKLINSIILSDNECVENKKKLNDIILKRNHDNAVRRHEKELINKDTYKIHRLKYDYVEDIEKLSNLLLDTDCNKDLRVILSTQQNDKKDSVDDISEQLPF